MANTITIIRDYPENGVSQMDIQEQDLPKLQSRGWKVKEVSKKVDAPKQEAVKAEAPKDKKEDAPKGK